MILRRASDILPLAALCLLLSSCAGTLAPQGMSESRALLQQTAPAAESPLAAEEYRSFAETVREAEALLKAGKHREAEELFLLAWMKGELLKRDLELEKESPAERERLRGEVEEAEREKRQAEAEREKRQAEAGAPEKPAAGHRPSEKPRPTREKPLPAFHTVRKGETLPLIAGQAEVYNDPSLWPLLYRANRDQIRDPRRVAAGQVLRIPRSATREEMAEARRFAQERPIN
ncbi:MAG TPA: LysM peptidoglycan-binding domain-containing protein [Verrucomicrobiae bacterium]|nr:LysM peptidoglycan-binding domain-containing protein [Verrucomicrobiae bacterium]